MISRRGFLKGAAALGPLSLLHRDGEARALPAKADVLSTPPTVEPRNGMPYRRFGRTGENVSILGVGGFHIALPERYDSKYHQEQHGFQ